VARVVGIAVTQPERFVAVRRFHLSEALMDTADGYASYIMAASPDTCGQAMDVPDIISNAVSLVCHVDQMDEPGAQTSMQEP
jgi:hypothetical protein